MSGWVTVEVTLLISHFSYLLLPATIHASKLLEGFQTIVFGSASVETRVCVLKMTDCVSKKRKREHKRMFRVAAPLQGIKH